MLAFIVSTVLACLFGISVMSSAGYVFWRLYFREGNRWFKWTAITAGAVFLIGLCAVLVVTM
jgi:hypothetical protein